MGKITRNDFVKVGNRYLIKNSNSIYVSQKDMENIINDNSYLNAMIDITSNECQERNIVKHATKSTSTNNIKKTRTTKE